MRLKQDCCELKYRKIKKKTSSEIKYVMRKKQKETVYTVLRVARWLSGRASDLRSSSRGFEPRRCCVTTLGKLFTP